MPTQIYKTKDGKRVPSVTTVISKNLGWSTEVLLKWQAKMFRAGKDPDKIKEEACDTGTLVHAYIEAYVYKKDVDKELFSKATMDNILLAQRGLEQFQEKEKEKDFKWVKSEIPLVSEELRYGGTIDGVSERCGIVGLGDLKTSNGIYPNHIIQLAAYRNLLVENNVCVPEEFHIIKISKDILSPDDEIVKFIPIEKSKMDIAFDVFKKLRELHDIQKELYIEKA